MRYVQAEGGGLVARPTRPCCSAFCPCDTDYDGDLTDDDRREISLDSLFERTQDAADRGEGEEYCDLAIPWPESDVGVPTLAIHCSAWDAASRYQEDGADG